MSEPTVRPSSQELADEALAFCYEIDRLEQENLGWGYQWEHLGDASKDIHALMRHVRALAARLQATEQALRAIEHWPFAVMKNAEADLSEIKEFARRALEGAAE